MNDNKKKEWYVTEEPHDLFKAAQRDIILINSEIKNEDFKFEEKVETICRSAAESVEKMLKGWLRDYDNELKIARTHDLEKLCKILISSNKDFEGIIDQCTYLNNYTTEFRYGSPFTIEKHEAKECLKNLKFVYDFHLIKKTRDSINVKYKFNVLPDDIDTLFGN